MALTKGFASNSKGVYAGGPVEKTEAKAAAAITPGAVLITNATDGSVSEAGAKATAIVGVALDNDWRVSASASITTALSNHASASPSADEASPNYVDFATGEWVPIGTAPGLRFMGIVVASSAALVYGDLLMTGASGELEKAAATTAAEPTFAETQMAKFRYIGQADYTPTGDAGQRILVEYLG